MHVYVHACIYTYLHAYIHTQTHKCAYMDACIHAYINEYILKCICIHAHIHACLHTCMHAAAPSFSKPILKDTYIHTLSLSFSHCPTFTQANTYIYKDIYTDTYTFIHAYPKSSLHIVNNSYMLIYTCIFPYICTPTGIFSEGMCTLIY